MHKFQSKVVVVIIALISSGCVQKQEGLGSSAGVTDSTITLGSSNALTGHASFLGSQYNRGSMAFFKEINESGGVFGRKIRVISYDDQYDPPQTVANTAKLINEDNVFLVRLKRFQTNSLFSTGFHFQPPLTIYSYDKRHPQNQR